MTEKSKYLSLQSQTDDTEEPEEETEVDEPQTNQFNDNSGKEENKYESSAGTEKVREPKKSKKHEIEILL